MPSGYEKSPDYGGPEPTLRGFLLALVAVAAIAAFVMVLGGIF